MLYRDLMIHSLEVKNFKSYQSGILHLAPLTLLIGANASGKSNIIEALTLLSKLAEGEQLTLLGYSQSSIEKLWRGQMRDLGYLGAKSFEIACTIENPSFPEWNRLEIELSIDREGKLQITNERMTTQHSTVPLYHIASEPQGAGRDVFVEYDDFAQGGQKPKIVCSSHRAVFTQLLSEIRFHPENQESQKLIPQVCEDYVNRLSRMIVLEPEPHRMRDYSYKTDKRMKRNAANISGVLYNLVQHASLKEQLLDWIRNLPEQEIADLGFMETDRGEVMLHLTETFGDRATPYDATMLSDGTLRVLAIAAVMLSAPQQTLVVIEEIDRGVHPSRAAGLLQHIYNTARSRHLQVLLSSHNPALLDALPHEAIPETVFCYRNRDRGSSELIRLQDIPDYPELIAQGTVGHLMTNNVLETFVKSRPGREDKKRKAMEWLTSIA